MTKFLYLSMNFIGHRHGIAIRLAVDVQQDRRFPLGPDQGIEWLHRLLHRSGSYRYQAGLELGRRFRDRIRAKRLGGLRIVSWQDVVPASQPASEMVPAEAE